jgi:hypothetical protein
MLLTSARSSGADRTNGDDVQNHCDDGESIRNEPAAKRGKTYNKHSLPFREGHEVRYGLIISSRDKRFGKVDSVACRCR